MAHPHPELAGLVARHHCPHCGRPVGEGPAGAKVYHYRCVEAYLNRKKEDKPR